MPRDLSLSSVLVIGSGPIVIGQACEFDYSGTQAIKALRAEGIRVILLNSNPASIMTDPELADRTYVEPITLDVAKQILERERPDAILPTMGGQTALNLARALGQDGILERLGIRLIGASLEAIDRAEDRERFKEVVKRLGLASAESGIARSLEDARALASRLGYPLILRPSFTLGGEGGGIARDAEDLERMCTAGLAASPTATVLIEESLLGWKEFELEVVRDRRGNAIIVCSIENLDPMGVHTGDSITVAPAQTLTDREYQIMRQAALAIVREVGVETGGANVQFAVNPRDGRQIVIEMNPRVSRSSALASKATGYPIAKIAAKLAIGYTLDELTNDITRDTPASFEPALDYVVVKIPRFTFEKFSPGASELSTTMRSVGEVMAIGRTFGEAYMKALRSLDTGGSTLLSSRQPGQPLADARGTVHSGVDSSGVDARTTSGQREGAPSQEAIASLAVPSPERPHMLHRAFAHGLTIEEAHALSKIDPWFLDAIRRLVEQAQGLRKVGDLAALTDDALREAKRAGFGDRELADLLQTDESAVRMRRTECGIRPVYKRVDTCAGEFEAHTPYLYATYEEEDEAAPTDRQKVLILGSGPIRIGQGIEFDYACVHAAMALREAGYEAIMVNCNPETVSTDYDTSDRLYFEPLTFEDVWEIAQREKPLGAIIQLGGQTPLRLARALSDAGVPILGTSPDAIDRAEDRERFAELLCDMRAQGLMAPPNGSARSLAEARDVAAAIGYPIMVRPSYVLGGRAMRKVHDARELEAYVGEALDMSPEHPILIDRFLEEAIEVDLDLVADRTGAVRIGGLLEHVEEAGVHSGDAASVLPPFSLSTGLIERMKVQATAMARSLGVIGLMNVQFAVQGESVFVLEVNPRASRTVPFVSKATGLALAKVATLCMVGRTLAEQNLPAERAWQHVAVKESVFPWGRFSQVDVVLGPEMRSTGEVMGIGPDFASAFAKSQAGAGTVLPVKPTNEAREVLLSVRDRDKGRTTEVARRLLALGFDLVATPGTHAYLAREGVESRLVHKLSGPSPTVREAIESGNVVLILNTVSGSTGGLDGIQIRRAAITRGLPYCTTAAAARMIVDAMERASSTPLGVRSLQELMGGAS